MHGHAWMRASMHTSIQALMGVKEGDGPRPVDVTHEKCVAQHRAKFGTACLSTDKQTKQQCAPGLGLRSGSGSGRGSGSGSGSGSGLGLGPGSGCRGQGRGQGQCQGQGYGIRVRVRQQTKQH